MTTYRSGAVGALMDEYERAAGELIRVLDGITDSAFELTRDTATTDEDCRSIEDSRAAFNNCSNTPSCTSCDTVARSNAFWWRMPLEKF